jgi:hypothetical protein
MKTLPGLKSLFNFLLVTALLFYSITVSSQTMGLLQHDAGTDDNGLVLFPPTSSNNTYLIDKCGKLIHVWADTATPGHMAYLCPDGNLLRTSNSGNTAFNFAGRGGLIKKIDWNDNVVWSGRISDATQCQHHDVKLMPNGNILAVVWAKKTKAEAIANGRRPNWVGNSLNIEKIVEIQPIGTDSSVVVWEWNVWDHLVQQFDSTKLNYGIIADHPERVSINYKGTVNPEWIHANSVDYNPEFDQILICAHNFNEIWVIDHSTTTEEAAGHTGGIYGKGGDLLWRWGNPYAYFVGAVSDQKLFGMHDAHWIKDGMPNAGKVILFNNGLARPQGNYSTVEILTLPYDAQGFYPPDIPCLPENPDWIYTAPVPTDFFSQNISGADQLPNGNVLICSGQQGIFFEVDSLKVQKWKYYNPVNGNGPQTQGNVPVQSTTFRAISYPKNFAGFTGHNLTPGDPIELNPLPYLCDLTTGIADNALNDMDLMLMPNPASAHFSIKTNLKDYTVQVYSADGRLVFDANISDAIVQNEDIPVGNWRNGIYLVKISAKSGYTFSRKLLIAR